MAALVLLQALLRSAAAHVAHDEIMALAVAPGGRVVLTYCEVRGLYRSTDSGLNWELVREGFPDCLQGDMAEECGELPYDSRQMALSFANDGATAFFAFSGALYSSADQGLNWRRVAVPRPVSVNRDAQVTPSGAFGVGSALIAASEAYREDRTVLVLAEQALLRSADGGITFAEVEAPPLRAVISLKPSGFLALTSTGELVASLQGSTWQPLAGQGSTLRGQPSSLAIVSQRACGCRGKLHVTPVATGFRGGVRCSCLLVRHAPSFECSVLSEETLHVAASAPLRLHGALVGSSPDGELVYVHDELVLLLERRSLSVATESPLSRRTSWRQIGDDDGLHYARLQAKASGRMGFSQIVSSVSHLFLGSFQGVFRSSDGGRTWAKLDLMLSLIQGIAVAPSPLGATHLTVATCLYEGGCVHGDIELAKLSDPRSRRKSAFRRLSTRCKTRRYDIVRYSPAYDSDRTLFYICSERLVRSTDGGKHWLDVTVPLSQRTLSDKRLNSGGAKKVLPMPHDVVFSPDFATDSTVFVTGFKIGVAKSTDGGRTFENIWARFTTPTSIVVAVHLALSPRYSADRTMVVTATVHQSEGCRDEQLWNTSTWDSRCFIGQSSGKTADGVMRRPVSRLFISQNGGSTWHLLGSLDQWNDVLLVATPKPIVIAIKAHKLVANRELTAGSWYPLSPKNDTREYALNGLAVQQDGEKAHLIGSALSSGGALLAIVNAAAVLDDAKFLSLQYELKSVGRRTASFSTTYLPPPDHLRGLGKLVAFSPRFGSRGDSVIFGADAFALLVSTDGGASWARVFKVPNSLLGASCERGQRYKFPNCRACRFSYSPERPKEFWSGSPPQGYADTAPLCYECNPGYVRTPQGPLQGCTNRGTGRLRSQGWLDFSPALAKERNEQRSAYTPQRKAHGSQLKAPNTPSAQHPVPAEKL